MYLAVGEKYFARNAFSKGLAACTSSEQENAIKKTLLSLNEEIIFSKEPSPDSVVYVVKKGDTLSKIGEAYDIPHEIIQRINDIKGHLIYPDQRLKVIKGPFDIVIELQKYRLTVYLKGNFIKEYPIGIGKAGISPIGKFKVKNKLRNPAWTKPGEQMAADDPENPLGERWIGIEGDYGIHGTIEPETIGQAASEGCIRMFEADVEELFDFVVVGKSFVEIRP
jgi:LysM repeat protein